MVLNPVDFTVVVTTVSVGLFFLYVAVDHVHTKDKGDRSLFPDEIKGYLIARFLIGWVLLVVFAKALEIIP